MPQGDTHFRKICRQAGLAVTHQRHVIYDVLCSIEGHPSPEEVYARVKRRIPAISLATVYGSMRVETNQARHYHLLCTGCKAIHDLDPASLGIDELPRALPGGFRMERLSIDVVGLCVACQSKSVAAPPGRSLESATETTPAPASIQ
jgi:Fur family peroxide stress response transcriptional regulator